MSKQLGVGMATLNSGCTTVIRESARDIELHKKVNTNQTI